MARSCALHPIRFRLGLPVMIMARQCLLDRQCRAATVFAGQACTGLRSQDAPPGRLFGPNPCRAPLLQFFVGGEGIVCIHQSMLSVLPGREYSIRSPLCRKHREAILGKVPVKGEGSVRQPGVCRPGSGVLFHDSRPPRVRQVSGSRAGCRSVAQCAGEGHALLVAARGAPRGAHDTPHEGTPPWEPNGTSHSPAAGPPSARRGPTTGSGPQAEKNFS